MGPKQQDLYSFNQIKELMKDKEETMMKFFNSAIDRLEKKIKDLTKENFNLKNDVNELKQSMQYHSDIMDQHITSEKMENKLITESVQEKLAELEDRSRRNNLRISGIEELGDENET